MYGVGSSAATAKKLVATAGCVHPPLPEILKIIVCTVIPARHEGYSAVRFTVFEPGTAGAARSGLVYC